MFFIQPSKLANCSGKRNKCRIKKAKEGKSQEKTKSSPQLTDHGLEGEDELLLLLHQVGGGVPEQDATRRQLRRSRGTGFGQ